MGSFLGLLLVSYLGLHLSKKRKVPQHWLFNIKAVSRATWVSAKNKMTKTKIREILSGFGCRQTTMCFSLYIHYIHIFSPAAQQQSLCIVKDCLYFPAAVLQVHTTCTWTSFHIPYPSPTIYPTMEWHKPIILALKKLRQEDWQRLNATQASNLQSSCLSQNVFLTCTYRVQYMKLK